MKSENNIENTAGSDCQERLVRGGVTYGVTIRWTDRNGQQSCGVDGCETAEEAWEQAEGFARRCGWTPPKWWQWWRWHDTRLPSANDPGDESPT